MFLSSGYSPESMPVVCFSHLRWDFVFQRPQHLLTRCARDRKVLFFEEPFYDEVNAPLLRLDNRDAGVTVATPVLPIGGELLRHNRANQLQELVSQLLDEFVKKEYICWYYTPMALPYTRHLRPTVTVYDCMDELSAFRGASGNMADLELELFEASDVVFTGGHSLYEKKRGLHRNVHLVPSGVDITHFGQAREPIADPDDQAHIKRPRVGFFGVLDERLDRDLLAGAASMRPGWQFILIGPIAKIGQSELPLAPNIHYLGFKSYADLPAYIANWDVAMMPFALNAATRCISPTKTPEYLAAGKAVVSTPVPDVIRGYGDLGLVSIACDAAQFALALDRAISTTTPEWRAQVDKVLQASSWDSIWQSMSREIANVISQNALSNAAKWRMLTPTLVSPGGHIV
jgi:UDP-galactopyranose mutase